MTLSSLSDFTFKMKGNETFYEYQGHADTELAIYRCSQETCSCSRRCEREGRQQMGVPRG